MRLIDLSSPVDAAGFEPNPVRHEILSPAEGARHMSEEMRAGFGLELAPESLPDAEFLSLDTLTLTTHTGTHVDAPSHYGSRAAYGKPRNIDELPLEWFTGPGCVLDATAEPVGALDAGWVRRELRRIGHEVRPGEIVLLHTGASARDGQPEYFSEFTGLDASAVHHLLDLGVRVIGTDAFSLDAPFSHIIRNYRDTGDSSVLWPAHFAGREREYCQIERLANLGALPEPAGFRFCCFPVKIKGAGAGWARAVAFVD
ncbi:cyclase family protein [Amycolatopsis acidicola]|uniref:Cyclase family protein n=1 Tax=Amycolatopsis acidicola TaxID=2596893 RepID=A0A5N0VLV3_9PSEU|nr:cyclase family protein [Amycolatopsis acidicola]KAA9166513.1 cyclase family protein [Amycolatopsis acidicola]